MAVAMGVPSAVMWVTLDDVAAAVVRRSTSTSVTVGGVDAAVGVGGCSIVTWVTIGGVAGATGAPTMDDGNGKH
jgi:hypothetical protein